MRRDDVFHFLNQPRGTVGDHENCLRMNGQDLHGLEPHVVWRMDEPKNSTKRAAVGDTHESLSVLGTHFPQERENSQVGFGLAKVEASTHTAQSREYA